MSNWKSAALQYIYDRLFDEVMFSNLWKDDILPSSHLHHQKVVYRLLQIGICIGLVPLFKKKKTLLGLDKDTLI